MAPSSIFQVLSESPSQPLKVLPSNRETGLSSATASDVAQSRVRKRKVRMAGPWWVFGLLTVRRSRSFLIAVSRLLEEVLEIGEIVDQAFIRVFFAPFRPQTRKPIGCSRQ